MIVALHQSPSGTMAAVLEHGGVVHGLLKVACCEGAIDVLSATRAFIVHEDRESMQLTQGRIPLLDGARTSVCLLRHFVECLGLGAQFFRLVYQLVQPLATIQHAFNGLVQDHFGLVDLFLHP
jgi:hypothetical protein